MYKTRWTFFSLLYLNNELGRSWFLLGLWKQCAKSCLHVISEITKWAGYRHRIDPLRSSISGQNKSLNMTFHLKKKITEKEQILTENYFDRSKSRNGYISDSIYFLCLLSRDHEFWTWSIELTYKIIKIILIFLFGTLATFQR